MIYEEKKLISFFRHRVLTIWKREIFLPVGSEAEGGRGEVRTIHYPFFLLSCRFHKANYEISVVHTVNSPCITCRNHAAWSPSQCPLRTRRNSVGGGHYLNFVAFRTCKCLRDHFHIENTEYQFQHPAIARYNSRSLVKSMRVSGLEKKNKKHGSCKCFVEFQVYFSGYQCVFQSKLRKSRRTDLFAFL